MAITLEDVVNAHRAWQPQPSSAPSAEGEEDTNLKEMLPWFQNRQRIAERQSPLANIKPAKVPQTSLASNDTDSFQRYAIGSALQRDLDPVTSLAMLQQESSWNPKNHGGLGNFTPDTAVSRKLDWQRLHTDPQYAMDSSFDYLKELTDKNGGDIQKGLTAYNGGGDPQYLSHVLRHVPAMNAVYNRHLPSILQEASDETAPSAQQPPAQGAESNIEDKAARGLLGAGETALSLGTAIVNWPLTTALKYGRIAREMVAPIEPGRKGVYQDAINQAKSLQEQYTYQPRTEEGKAISGYLGKPLEYWGHFVDRVGDWADEAGVAPEHKLLLKDALETVGIFDFGLVTGKAVGALRSSAAKFRSQLNKSIESGTPTEGLIESAQRISEVANGDPELVAQRSKLVEALKAREEQLGGATPEEGATTPETQQLSAAAEQVQEPGPAGTLIEEAAGDAQGGQLPTALGSRSVANEPPQFVAETPAAPPALHGAVDRAGRPKSDLQMAMEELDPRWRSKYPPVEEPELPTTLRPTKPVEPKEPLDSVITTPQGEIVDQAPGLRSPTPEEVVTDQGVRLGLRKQRGSRTKSFSSEPEGPAELWQLLRKDNPNPSEPTKFTSQEKADYVAKQTRPIPTELRERIESAIESGEDISDRLGKDIRQPIRVEYSEAKKAYDAARRANALTPEVAERFENAKKARDLADEFKSSLEKERKGIGESSDRSIMDILKDLKTAIWEWDVNPNSLGMNFSEARLSRKQRMALQRLQDDALRYKEDIGDYLEAFQQGHEGMELTPAHIALFRSYLSQIKNPPPPSGTTPANMRLDGEATTTDPVVSQRKEYPKGTKLPKFDPTQPELPGMPSAEPTTEPLRIFPPTYRSEASLLHNANEIPPRPIRLKGEDFGVELPLYTLRKAGLSDLSESYRRVNKAASVESQQTLADLNELRRTTTMASRANIAAEAYSRDAEGLVLLEDQLGRTAPDGLTSNEQVVSSSLESAYGEMFDRANRARVSIGLDELPRPENLHLFVRTWNVLRELGKGVNLLHDDADTITKIYQDNINTPFPKTFTQKRLGMKYEMDLFTQAERFLDRTTKQVHFAPLVGKLNELINEKLPNPRFTTDPKTGEFVRDWSLQAEKPELWKWLNDWKNDLQGKAFFSTKYDGIMRKLNENMVHGVISGNLGPALAQVTSLPKVAWETNPYYTLRALEMSLEDIVTNGRTDHRGLAFRESNILSTIKAGRMYGDFADSFNPETLRGIGQALREGRLRDIKTAIGRGGATPVQFLDIETSVIAYNAAKMYGAEKLGLEGEALRRYADDVVVRTQHTPGVGDRAPIQRSQAGRTLTLFQSYTIKEWNWLTRDVLGYDNPSITNKQAIKNVAGLVALYSAWNILSEDVFHVPSALPTPVRDAMRAAGRSPNVFHFGQQEGESKNPLQIAGSFLMGLTRIPVVSGARYGKGMMGPVLTTITQDLPNALTGKQGAAPLAETGAKAIGVPFVSQEMKIYRSIKRGEQSQLLSPWDRFTGWNEPSASGGGGSLEGLRGGRLRSRLKGLR